MIRWRVDFRVKSAMVLAKQEPNVTFRAPDGSHEIQLFTRTGKGEHAADELYLSAHVILDDEEPKTAGDRASAYLRAFLNVLSVVTSTYYRIEARLFVVDWRPGLSRRRFLLYKIFPNPNVPIYGLEQAFVTSATQLMSNDIPGAVMLAIRWWARGVGASPPSDQFQYFWYALEILAEFDKPTAVVPDKCPKCGGNLYCESCETVPVHRPYPKQAIRMLVMKHVTGDPEGAFVLWDKARNALLHGTERKEIERSLGFTWLQLADSLGKAVWASLLSYLATVTGARATEPGGRLHLADASTYMHYELTVIGDAEMAAVHKDPENPLIDEFHPEVNLELIVKDSMLSEEGVDDENVSA